MADYNDDWRKGGWYLVVFTACMVVIFGALLMLEGGCGWSRFVPGLPMKPVPIPPTPSGWESPRYDYPGLSNALIHPSPPPPILPVMAPVMRLEASQPGQTCLTNAQTGATRCFPVAPKVIYGGWLYLFPCTTNQWNHSVVQSSPDMQTWSDIPASAFGYSNYTSPYTYLYGSSNAHIGLIITNDSPTRFYRMAWRD